MKRKIIACFLICQVISCSLIANEACCYPCELDDCMPFEQPCSFSFTPYLASRWGKGRGYERGFQSIEVVGAFSRNSNRFLFTDLRILRVEPGKIAGNLGVGWRTAVSPSRDLFGVNVFYDFRNYSKHYFHQFGLGIEYLTCFLDLRMNGYLPVGEKQARFKQQTFDYGDGFIANIEELQNSLWGLDVEIGKHFRFEPLGFCLFVGIGPYYYDDFICNCCPTSFLGGMARVSATICNNLNLEFFYTYDRIFKGRPQFQITWSLPFTCLGPCLAKFISRVERNPIIVTTPSCEYQTNF